MMHLLLNDPVRGPKLAGLAVITGLIGVVGLLSSIGHLASQPWDLQRNGVVTRAVTSDCGPWFGDTYSIDVDGRRIKGCVEGNRKCPLQLVEILYDPNDPQRCRSKATASRPGDYEMTAFLGSLGSSLCGAVAVVWWANGGIYAIHSGNKARTWFYWLATLVAIAATSLAGYLHDNGGI